ncbi:hypothetical protein, variant 1 [Aphanomyces invadans]|uniref:Ion transport domain-containing protein n=1 Tax=Aphanomyces invadans TaxID=157072 RepID=A0A024UVC6_9STRA|nr:hypothetical protein, variant 1 [Aphanomyces invadans]ETW09882.1 hypothetical protein, variant 1 [Aphanomyces invadans]|eukprot:XP_008861293.1 hypothetical protein, variant 1 [Aphanomyces invadans]
MSLTTRKDEESHGSSRRDSVALADVMDNLPPEVLATLEAPDSPRQTAQQRQMNEAEKARLGGWRRRVRKLVKNSRSSRWGRVYHYTMLGAIVTNFIPMMLQTLDGPANGGSDPMYPFLPFEATYFAWEVFFTAVFGLDLIVKVVVAKRQRKFWTRANNWVDVLGILPLFGSLLMQYELQWAADRRQPIERYMKLLRLFRIIRVVYMLRDVDGIRVLRTTFLECIPPLQITLFFLITIVMMFGTMLYYAEPCYNYTKCPFTDIFNAGYFVMVSVATVGYGDQVPDLDNPISVLVTSAILIFGALYLAMPLAIIGIKYELTWLRYEIKTMRTTTSLSTKSTARHPATVKVTSAHPFSVPSEDIHPHVHAAYTQYLDLVKDVTTLEDMVHTIMAIPPHDVLDGHASRLHVELLETLNQTCKQVIVMYQKFMVDMRVFQPVQSTGLAPGESPNRRARSRASSLSSMASDVIHRAKRAIHQKLNHTTLNRQASTLDGKPLPFRKRLRRALEQPSSTTHAIWLNWFFYAHVLFSVFMFYAETTPELQAYGPDSFLCRRAMGTYCKPPTRSSATDPGCFVWTSNTTVTSTKLSFDCQNGTECYGSGWNVGSPTASMACEDSFAFPQRMCHLRECKPDHAPLVDMTALWFYPEAYFAFVFTMEFSLRLYATKRRCKLVQSMGSWLDIGAVIPFYAEVAASWMEARPTLFAIVPTFPTVMSVLPILKTLRVLKMGKHFKASSVLARTAVLTYRRLLIPLFFLFLGCVSAGAIFYEVERGIACRAHLPCLWWRLDIMTQAIAEPFSIGKRIQIQIDKLTIVTDMWRSTWLSIVTLTTVGYGDLKPRTPVGRFIDILVMVFGSCYTAMPLSLIGGQFYYCYEQYFKQQQVRSPFLSFTRGGP